MKKIINYNPKLKKLAKELRNNSTLAEVLLWKRLRNKQVRGLDWHRQKPIDNYIVDFYCSKHSLAIEIDGYTHYDKEKEDELRQKNLENLGIKFLRFSDKQVKNNMNSVIMEIEDWIDNHGLHPPA